jgi:hypothetical protein
LVAFVCLLLEQSELPSGAVCGLRGAAMGFCTCVSRRTVRLRWYRRPAGRHNLATPSHSRPSLLPSPVPPRSPRRPFAHPAFDGPVATPSFRASPRPRTGRSLFWRLSRYVHHVGATSQATFSNPTLPRTTQLQSVERPLRLLLAAARLPRSPRRGRAQPVSDPFGGPPSSLTSSWPRTTQSRS